jgi:hypothetical protein
MLSTQYLNNLVPDSYVRRGTDKRYAALLLYGRKPLVTRFGGIPLRRQRGAFIADRVPVPVIIRHKELVTRLLADRCEICTGTDGISVYHVRRLADLTRPGQPQPAWAAQMARRRRKPWWTAKPVMTPSTRATPYRSSRSSHRRPTCGESRMRRSGWGRRRRTRTAGTSRRPTSALWHNLGGGPHCTGDRRRRDPQRTVRGRRRRPEQARRGTPSPRSSSGPGGPGWSRCWWPASTGSSSWHSSRP